MNAILRLFLTLSSVSYFLVVYLIQNKIYFFTNAWKYMPWFVSVAYLLIPVGLTIMSLSICKKLPKRSVSSIKTIETSNNDFLANYLAFFFVALSVNDSITFWIVFTMTIVFTFFSRVSYFNPMFLVFRYNFYYITTAEGVKIMLITRKRLKDPSSFNKMNPRKINDYTFIDI